MTSDILSNFNGEILEMTSDILSNFNGEILEMTSDILTILEITPRRLYPGATFGIL